VVSQWAYNDPAAAAAWAKDFPDEASRSSAFQNIASTWGREDPAAAAEWLKTLAEGKSRDSAVRSYVSQISNYDPSTALAWAQTLSDDRMRQSSVENAARQWMQVDPNKATAWINSSSLSPETKTSLLQSGARTSGRGVALPPRVFNSSGVIYAPGGTQFFPSDFIINQ
jgi:hypothetical protein